ncbi:hypothetical protein K502DRAFT_364733 [Neoconidiobolus thromboides FSU 785]|nr:hypothetical protein K502DRAFT_364733 [Neoconidiobolus thromboides FSU 785]
MLQATNTLNMNELLNDIYEDTIAIPPPPYTPIANPEFEAAVEFGPNRIESIARRCEVRELRRRYLLHISPPLISDFILPNFHAINHYKLNFKKNSHLLYCLISLGESDNKELRVRYSHLNVSLEHIQSHRTLGEINTNNGASTSTTVLSHDIQFTIPSYPSDVKSRAQFTSYQDQFLLTIEEELQFIRYKWKRNNDGYRLYRKTPLIPSNALPTNPLSRSSSKYDRLIATLSFSSNGEENQATLHFPTLQSNVNTLNFIITAAYLLRYVKNLNGNNISSNNN